MTRKIQREEYRCQQNKRSGAVIFECARVTAGRCSFCGKTVCARCWPTHKTADERYAKAYGLEGGAK